MEVQTDDFFQDMLDSEELYDFSDYHGSHPIQNLINQKFDGDKVQVKQFIDKNKKVAGKMKDESGTYIIESFICLKAKC